MFIETVTPRCIIGAHYSQQNLFRIDPETGRIEHAEGMIARVPGQPMCALGFGGRAYLGIYVNSIVSLYDPAKPFIFGKNPLELIDLSVRYEQTRPRDAVTDGRLIYISSDSSYSKLGGALAVIDPQTHQIDVYHHLVRDQNLPTLAFEPVSGLLWGGTNRWGQMRSHPPTQESALIYAFDTRTRQVVATLIPWKGVDEASVAGILRSGVLVACNGPELALIDTRTREILIRGASPVAGMRRIRRGSDGFSYCLADSMMYRWDPAANVLTPVAHAPECRHLSEVTPGRWALASRTSIFVVEPGSR
jgi:hypothetical protein